MFAKLKNIRKKMKQHIYLFNLSSPKICLPTAEDIRKYREGRMFNDAFYENKRYSRFLDSIIRNLDMNPLIMQELLRIREEIAKEESRMTEEMPEKYILSEALESEKDKIIKKRPVWCRQEDMNNISSNLDSYKAALAICRKCFQLWPTSVLRDLVFIVQKEGKKLQGPLCESCAR